MSENQNEPNQHGHVGLWAVVGLIMAVGIFTYGNSAQLTGKLELQKPDVSKPTISYTPGQNKPDVNYVPGQNRPNYDVGSKAPSVEEVQASLNNTQKNIVKTWCEWRYPTNAQSCIDVHSEPKNRVITNILTEAYLRDLVKKIAGIIQEGPVRNAVMNAWADKEYELGDWLKFLKDNKPGYITGDNIGFFYQAVMDKTVRNAIKENTNIGTVVNYLMTETPVRNFLDEAQIRQAIDEAIAHEMGDAITEIMSKVDVRGTVKEVLASVKQGLQNYNWGQYTGNVATKIADWVMANTDPESTINNIAGALDSLHTQIQNMKTEAICNQCSASSKVEQ